jgi:hypothetical protein
MTHSSPLSIEQIIAFCQSKLRDDQEAKERPNVLYGGKEPHSVYTTASFTYRIFADMKAIIQGDHLKRRDLSALLRRRGAKNVLARMPTHATSQSFGAYGFASVSKPLEGAAKPQSKLGAAEFEQVGAFLSDLHSSGTFKTVNEFGFLDSGNDDFGDYVLKAAQVYNEMLRPDINDEVRSIVDAAVNFLERSTAGGKLSSVDSVIVHKDVLPENLYWLDGQLSGVDGWETAQTAPKEWDLAIAFNRFPQQREAIRSGYKAEINADLLRVCSVTQALRFWKSYRFQTAFEARQVESIKVAIASN